MHGSWYKCLHGSCLADSFNKKSSIQTAHWLILSTSSWSISIIGKFWICISDAGAAPRFVFRNWFISVVIIIAPWSFNSSSSSRKLKWNREAEGLRWNRCRWIGIRRVSPGSLLLKPDDELLLCPCRRNR